MAKQLTDYKCPACTGPMHFDPDTGKLKCDYCDSIYTLEEVEAMFAGQNEAAAEAAAQAEKPAAENASPDSEWDVSGMAENWGVDGKNITVYHCSACNAELLCEKTTAATTCPYCGSNQIIPGKLSGELKPDFVIPFKVKREEAIAALHKHYGGKKLLPRCFSEENHIQEVQGMYVPFWLFDGEGVVDAEYTAQKVIVNRTPNEEVTTTSFFELVRKGRIQFSKIPVDGSKRMDDALMDSIEPFDYKELKPFSMAYLPGYVADKYDMTVADCAPRADHRAKNTVKSNLSRSLSDFSAVVPKKENITLRRGKVHYALLPVWMLSTKWNGEQYIFAMNGQTGKLVGDLPMDKGLYNKYRLIYGGVIAAAIYAIGWIVTML